MSDLHGSCMACKMYEYSLIGSSQCLACADGKSSFTSSASCEVPLSTSSIRQAVNSAEEGGIVIWKSGTGVLEQTWSDPWGWEITMAFTWLCTGVAEKCVIDAMASASSQRTVLIVYIPATILTFSNFVGLAIRGGHREPNSGGRGGGIGVRWGAKVNIIDCEISNNHAPYGAGIYIGTDVVIVSSIHGTKFADNTAGNTLGVDIFGMSGDIDVRGCTFSFTTTTNVYTDSATITFQGSECDSGRSTRLSEARNGRLLVATE